jgi:hypothetical protein
MMGTARSEAEAWSRGAVALDALQLAFARLRIAADFGRRTPNGGFTNCGFEWLGSSTEHPIFNDEHGLMVYPALPVPQFASMGTPTVQLIVQGPRLAVALRAALERDHELDDRERIAYDLFTASFFEHSADARLISLVMAIETLLEPVERSLEARSHVQDLIEATKHAELSTRERDSLVGSLRWLLKESISSAGKRLVTEKLGDRRFGNLNAPQLWRTAYNIRGRLVHGGTPRPPREDVDRCAANLEVMVASLLSGPLLELDI